MKEFKMVERALTLDGKIPLPPAIYGKTEKLEYPPELEKHLFELHLDKIRISDGIFVIDPDGRLGDSTTKEIAFAKDNGKPVQYYSKEAENILKKNETLDALKKRK
jgi:hypothetical protein